MWCNYSSLPSIHLRLFCTANDINARVVLIFHSFLNVITYPCRNSKYTLLIKKTIESCYHKGCVRPEAAIKGRDKLLHPTIYVRCNYLSLSLICASGATLLIKCFCVKQVILIKRMWWTINTAGHILRQILFFTHVQLFLCRVVKNLDRLCKAHIFLSCRNNGPNWGKCEATRDQHWFLRNAYQIHPVARVLK